MVVRTPAVDVRSLNAVGTPQNGGGLSSASRLVRLGRALERLLGGDGDERAERLGMGVDALEVVLDELDRRHLAATQQRGLRGGVEVVQLGHAPSLGRVGAGRLNELVQLTDLVTTFDAVRATRSRKAKIAAVADALRQAGDDVFVVATYLSGALTQRRTGVGWRSLTDLPDPGDRAVAHRLGGRCGVRRDRRRRPARARRPNGAAFWTRCSVRRPSPSRELLGGLITGEIRTGALEGVLVEGIAAAYEIPATVVRRAVMLAGSAPFAARAAATGGEEALAAIGLEVGRAVQPMLAGSAPDLAAGLDAVGLPCLVDGKLDGIRIQVHRAGSDVSVWSRSLDDLTGRFPELVELARSLPATSFVLDGEALLVDDDGRPRAFQDTASRSMTVTRPSWR